MRQIFCIMWLCLSFDSYAQKKVIRATVKDSVTHEVLPFANIVLLSDSMFLTSITTDSLGQAEFTRAANVSQLSVSSFGYKTNKEQTNTLFKELCWLKNIYSSAFR